MFLCSVIRIHAHAHAAGYVNQHVFNLKWLLQRLNNAKRQTFRHFTGRIALNEHHKLIAANPGNQIRFPDRCT